MSAHARLDTLARTLEALDEVEAASAHSDVNDYVEVVVASDMLGPAVLKEIELANCGVSECDPQGVGYRVASIKRAGNRR